MTDVAFQQLKAHDRFLELVRQGTPQLNAALEVGWTPKQLRLLQQDVEFRDMIASAEQELDGSIEMILVREAQKGKQWAVQMWLFNRQPDRWRDLKRIEVRTDTTISIGVVQSVKQATMSMLREMGVEAMQELPPVLDVDSEEL